MVKRARKKKVKTKTAVLATIFNLLFPGLGSLIGVKYKVGIEQMTLVAVSFIFIFMEFELIGIPIFFGTWVWGIVTSVKIMSGAGLLR